MKTIVKLSNGQEFEGFIPIITQIRYFFSFKELTVDKILWRNVKTRVVYYFDRNNSQLVPIKMKSSDNACCANNTHKEK